MKNEWAVRGFTANFSEVWLICQMQAVSRSGTIVQPMPKQPAAEIPLSMEFMRFILAHYTALCFGYTCRQMDTGLPQLKATNIASNLWQNVFSENPLIPLRLQQ
jgi:hypothetical protein